MDFRARMSWFLAVNLTDRYRGALFGLAVGSALGAAYQSRAPGSLEPPEEPNALEPGRWTGTASMAVCLAGSLLERRGFDPRDQMDRYLQWWRQSRAGSNGSAPEPEPALWGALSRYESTGDPFAGSDNPAKAGSSSLARLAPIPMYLIHDGARAKEIAAQMSRTTDATVDALDACRYMTGLIVGALRNESKEALLSDLYSPVYNYWLFQHVALSPAIDCIARGIYKQKQATELAASGSAADTLEAALWAFHKTSDFAAGALLAVRLAHNAETTAAVYGQLAGAYYGYANFPDGWREKVARRTEIEDLAIALMHETKQSIRHFT